MSRAKSSRTPIVAPALRRKCRRQVRRHLDEHTEAALRANAAKSKSDAMCLFICANPHSRDWFAATVDHALRKSLQLCPVEPSWSDFIGDAEDASDAQQISEADRLRGRLDVCYSHCNRRAMERPTWIRALRTSPPRRQNALEALADAWCRLLWWVGWRR
jgi:hypothetical protein